MPSVGEELRRERELRGIGLEEIADETNIGIRFLEAIDADQLEVIPGEFYRRASLKAYAEYLGIDADRILATHEFRSEVDSATPQLLHNEPGAGNSLKGSRANKWVGLIIGALGLSVGVFVVWPVIGTLSSSVPHSANAPEEVDKPTAAIAASPVNRNETASTSGPVVRDEIDEVVTEQLPLRLIVRVDEPCWLEVRADSEIAAQGLMLRGFEKEIQAEEELRLWLGNAGGVSIWLNERPCIPLGRPGQVRKDILITPENLNEFIESEGAEVVPVSEGSGQI